MSDISENCYCAGWLDNTEYFVPELCRRAVESGQAQVWGHGEVTIQQARELMEMARRAGSWANLDEPGIDYIPFQPFPIPIAYIEQIEREQEHRAKRR